MSLTFKVATKESEFEQIHRLNYKTFVEEIPQHMENQTDKLIDKFHDENTYLICCKNERVIGMLAVRDQRPFSLDHKLHDLENHIPKGYHHLYEIRLLAVEKTHRSGRVFLGLAQLMAKYGEKSGYDLGLMSGTTRQLKLYQQMGFVPFADLVGSKEALYQPMYITKQSFEVTTARILSKPLHFLPGPVPIHPSVQKALQLSPISHRTKEFLHVMKSVRSSLLTMTQANQVEILVGTGTLANDVIAAQLSLHQGDGLILINGEFGQRLRDHASRAGLSFSVIERPWGEAFSDEDIVAEIKSKNISWLWAVHCETSTDMLQSMKRLKEISLQYHVHLCLDCISSIGAIQLDLQGVYLASGVSGKAIGSYTGLSFVFHEENVQPSLTLPRYLDLGTYQKEGSIPYSHSSHLLYALRTALKAYDTTERYDNIHSLYWFIRLELQALGMTILTSEEHSSPVIMTIPLSKQYSSTEIGNALEDQGILVHYESDYLIVKNWIQMACLGDYDKKEMVRMLKALGKIVRQQKTLVM